MGKRPSTGPYREAQNLDVGVETLLLLVLQNYIFHTYIMYSDIIIVHNGMMRYTHIGSDAAEGGRREEGEWEGGREEEGESE